MYGTSAFAERTFGARPLVWRLIFDALGLPACASQLASQGSAEASADVGLQNPVSMDGRVEAMFLSAGALSASALSAPLATVLWNAGSALGFAAQTAGTSGALSSSAGLATGSGYLTGYRMRAYDQAFPANPSSGSIVQIGSRFFEWKVFSARWHPAAPVPVP
ncbi:hypothetical protein ABL840_38635 [Variovorax sp. NFACC27]|uniref:hypothetical protein n=1 Tax=unclassified Variovorax TaxID=663243 RepID=UPI00115FA72A